MSTTPELRTIDVATRSHRQMVDITARVQEAVAATGQDEGVCLVYVPHTTAAVVINESADPDVARDLLAAYEAMIPDVRFAHAEGNSDAHLLTTLLGESVSIPVTGGRLALGTWQGVFLVELDGPRTRRVRVMVR
jgi:secondary thiamine-phosphate synthase enzyme